MTDTPETEKIRIDKWLWHARFFKTRTLASEVVQDGPVRVNRRPIRKASHAVCVGDVLTFPQGPHVRVIEIMALSHRRGPASEAQGLYRDLSPPVAAEKRGKPDLVAPREAGAGRPTKKERRDLDRLRAQDDV
jgi:ribosome-associated heat shock protein Hsp15